MAATADPLKYVRIWIYVEPQGISLVDINPSTNAIWITLEDNLNQEISLEGYMVWGYAESRYFEVTKAARSHQ